jgi:hypothetical protein
MKCGFNIFFPPFIVELKVQIKQKPVYEIFVHIWVACVIGLYTEINWILASRTWSCGHHVVSPLVYHSHARAVAPNTPGFISSKFSIRICSSFECVYDPAERLLRPPFPTNRPSTHEQTQEFLNGFLRK